MFFYKDSQNRDVVVIYGKCGCRYKRAYVFQKRTRKFCFCCNVKTQTALWLLITLTISYGLFGFFWLTIFIMKENPSGISMFVLYSSHTIPGVLELLIFLASGVLLKVGIWARDFKIILIYPWSILLGYIIAVWYLIIMIFYGEQVVSAIFWSWYTEKPDVHNADSLKQLMLVRVMYYGTMIFHIILLILITTYLSILSISYIERLMEEVDDEI